MRRQKKIPKISCAPSKKSNFSRTNLKRILHFVHKLIFSPI